MHGRFPQLSSASWQRWSAAVALSMVLVGWSSPSNAASNLPPAVGWDAGRLETGRGAALSGAELAVSSSLSGLFSNPANMASSRVYHAGALASIWPEASRQTYGAALVDSHTSSTGLTGGISAAWIMQDPDGLKRSGTDFRLALAFPFSDKLRIGAGMKYLSMRQNGTGPLGTSQVSSGLAGQPIIKDIGFDVGLTLQPIQALSIGMVGLNLNQGGNAFLPMLAGGGIGGGTENFTLEADLLADFSTWEKTKLKVMGGGELLVADHFPIRAGYRYDEGTRQQWVSLGAGYTDRAMGLELGVRRTVSGAGATAIVFSFVYHVESAGVGSTTTDVY